MSQNSTERLKDYLAQLPPQSQALLMRELERAVERGDDVTVANLVLEQLRKIVRGVEEDEQVLPRTDDPARLLFRPLEPFLAETNFPTRPGQVKRGSLLPIWQWLAREGAPEPAREFEAALAAASDSGPIETAARKFQLAAAEAIIKIATPVQGEDRQRALSRVGPPAVIDDLLPIGAVLQAHEALETLGSRLPSQIRMFADSQIASATDALKLPSLQTPQLLPFALSLIAQRLAAPWQIVRLAIKMAASDDELRVAATPYGIAVTIALHDLSFVAACLRTDIRRGHFDYVGEQLKTLHDGVRGLRTELDLRNDSTWGRQLTSVRADTSNALQSEIDSVPGRVRRILRQRADKDISAGAKIDQSEVEDAAALIDFVAVCRTYASELAINEVTLRTFSDLQHYVEQSTEGLVQSLRGGDARVRVFRQQQVKAAIRFCEVLFGHDYASLMNRAAENAITGERKSSRAG
ncbi:hypothetical protein IC762_13010 [Bradyrhizobium genosp. L]|uniref:hypothetical protein n=1 Tax=Bradyrhizobium genosp. L TaxID=83637 RepID=UPI0018A29E2F|nr:hypothetical protein [Bradyrhizobium genosp. L]QPF87147.1 hypothetical protein IC762_13010 [Bradyrhizobium genosp. L]